MNVRPADGAFLLVLLLLLATVTAWSAWQPHDVAVWFLEAGPVLVAAPLLAATRRRFPLTPLVYAGIFAHSVILLVGAHYTYEFVPIGDWAREAFDLSRNHYDRLGHVAQGFFPALIAREVFLRTSPLQRGKWLFFLVTCFCLAFSALYELIEWWVAVFGSDEQGNAFLGTQGDIWDSQWDMFLALCGAIAAQLTLSRTHDAQLGMSA